MDLTLKIWRQDNPEAEGSLVTYEVTDVSPDMSFLDMLDELNNRLIREGKETPIAFDSDCREGICGMCGLVINGRPHGPQKAATTCQLHMRSFEDGDVIVIEPFRATGFPLLKDLSVDREAFDRIIQAGGFISVNTGGAPDGNAILIGKEDADNAMDAAQCIGCGACVAACKNASAMLFTSAKVSHMEYLPQGQAEKKKRVRGMVAQMDIENFGNCTNEGECEAECPKEISILHIARMNRSFLRHSLLDSR